jgi:uncharacterized protein with FMN-binding domain
MNNKNLVTYTLIGVALIVILGAGGYWYFQSTQPTKAPVIVLPKTSTPSVANQPEVNQPAISSNQLVNNNGKMESDKSARSVMYRDGQYTATGNYVSPGGAQALDIKATLKDGVITNLEMTTKATDPKSERYQNIFKQSISGVIIGKPLNDNLDPGLLNGSSLTHTGFTQAIEAIKVQAANK